MHNSDCFNVRYCCFSTCTEIVSVQTLARAIRLGWLHRSSYYFKSTWDVINLSTIADTQFLAVSFFFWRKYVKEQKEHRDEISRVSGSALDKVREETVALRQVLLSVIMFLGSYSLFATHPG